MANDSRPSWQLLFECAVKLTQAGRTPFSRKQLIDCVHKTDPSRLSDSLNPVIQGMTENAKGGVPSAGGRTLRRVGRGLYELASESKPSLTVSQRSDGRGRRPKERTWTHFKR